MAPEEGFESARSTNTNPTVLRANRARPTSNHQLWLGWSLPDDAALHRVVSVRATSLGSPGAHRGCTLIAVATGVVLAALALRFAPCPGALADAWELAKAVGYVLAAVALIVAAFIVQRTH